MPNPIASGQSPSSVPTTPNDDERHRAVEAAIGAALIWFWPRFVRAMTGIVAPIAMAAGAVGIVYFSIGQHAAFQDQLDAMKVQLEDMKTASAQTNRLLAAYEAPAESQRRMADSAGRQAEVTGSIAKADTGGPQPAVALDFIEIKNFDPSQSGALDTVLQFKNTGPVAVERVRIRKRIVIGTPRNYRMKDGEPAEMTLGANDVQSISVRTAQASPEQRRRILAGQSAVNVFGEVRIATAAKTTQCIRYRWTYSGSASEPTDNTVRLHPAETGNGPC